jgi:hypothetical protein
MKQYHKCNYQILGDWEIYTCPLCPDYEIKINLKTNELKRKNIKMDINHCGTSIDDLEVKNYKTKITNKHLN